MRIKLPPFSSKKDLHAFLVANKSVLIQQKKSMPIVSDGVKSMPTVLSGHDLKEFGVKGFASKQDQSLPEGVLRVKTVANASNFVDSHMDLLVPDSPAKSIRERKGLIPHLHDHIHRTDAEVGDVVDILLLDIPIIELGYNMPGTTQCVVFLTDIKESYNPKIFNRYRDGKAKQHSIGLQYVKLELAINDPEWEKEKDFFDKYYAQIINKDVVDESGYFWVVQEYKLIENSVVLFGSNMYTPTLEVAEGSKVEPSDTQQDEPDLSTQKKMEALKRIINNFEKLTI